MSWKVVVAEIDIRDSKTGKVYRRPIRPYESILELRPGMLVGPSRFIENIWPLGAEG